MTDIERAIEKLESAVRWLKGHRHPNDIPIARGKIRQALKILEKLNG